MGCHAAPWPPGFGDFGERLRVRTFAQTEGEACGFLHGEVAGRKGIRVPEAKEKIDISSPWPDPMQGGERGVRLVGIHVAHGSKIDPAFGDRFADFADRFDLRGGESKAPELVGARAAHGIVVKWIERGEESGTDRGGACGGELLPANDRAQAGKSRLAPTQVERTGFFGDRFEPRVCDNKLCEARPEIGLTMEEVSHALSV